MSYLNDGSVKKGENQNGKGQLLKAVYFVIDVVASQRGAVKKSVLTDSGILQWRQRRKPIIFNH